MVDVGRRCVCLKGCRDGHLSRASTNAPAPPPRLSELVLALPNFSQLAYETPAEPATREVSAARVVVSARGVREAFTVVGDTAELP